MMHYTEQMIADLKLKSEYNYNDCKAFAEANPSVTARSVMAKVKSLGLTYKAGKLATLYVMKKGDFFGDEIAFA